MSKSPKERAIAAATKCMLLCVEQARLACDLVEPFMNKMVAVDGGGQMKPDKAEILHMLANESMEVIMGTLIHNGILVPPKAAPAPESTKPPQDIPENIPAEAVDEPKAEETPPKPRLLVD